MQDIFGTPLNSDILLRDKFEVQYDSALDTKSGAWINRKRSWKKLGIKSEVGRDVITYNMDEKYTKLPKVSTFDPVTCELFYNWFCGKGGSTLDPFAGGSVRGIVAHYLGYKYTGIDIRQEQVDSNIEQAIEILKPDNQPNWIAGDSDIVLDDMTDQFDFLFSCPPYADLEKYSDLPGDVSNMEYGSFLPIYESIIDKSCKLLKPGGYACFVVGEVRNKKSGDYIGFVPDTIRAFEKFGMTYYNEIIMLTSLGTAAVRAKRQFTANAKLVKVHQNALIFKKPE